MDTKTSKALTNFQNFCELLHLSEKLAPTKAKRSAYDYPVSGAMERWQTLTSQGNENYFLQKRSSDFTGSTILCSLLIMDSIISLFSNACESTWGFVLAIITISFAILGFIIFLYKTNEMIVSWSPAGLDAWAKLKPELDEALPYVVSINHHKNDSQQENNKYFLLGNKPVLGNTVTITELSVKNKQLIVNQHIELITSIEECKPSSSVFSKLVDEIIDKTITK